MLLLQPSEVGDQMSLSGFDAALIGLYGLCSVLDEQAGVVQQSADVLAQGPLIVFERQDVIGPLVFQLPTNSVAMHRVRSAWGATRMCGQAHRVSYQDAPASRTDPGGGASRLFPEHEDPGVDRTRNGWLLFTGPTVVSTTAATPATALVRARRKYSVRLPGLGPHQSCLSLPVEFPGE